MGRGSRKRYRAGGGGAGAGRPGNGLGQDAPATGYGLGTGLAGMPVAWFSGYDGANASKARGNVWWPSLDPRQELDSFSRSELLRRIHWLKANFGFIRGLIRNTAELVGFQTPQAKSGNDDWDERAEEAFRFVTGEAEAFDVAGKFDFEQAQTMLMREALTDGDVLTVLTSWPNGAARVMFYKTSQLTNPKNAGEEWRDGIKIVKGPDVERTEDVLFIDALAPQGMMHARYSQMKPWQDLSDWRDDSLERLEQLAAARCVVTSRLHVAMPCAAIGTPCLLLGDGDKHMVRFKGLSQFVSFIPKWDDGAIREFVRDVPENPNAKLREELAEGLRTRIREFYEKDVAGAPFVASGPPKEIKRKAMIADIGCDWKVAIPSFPGVPMDPTKVRGDVSLFEPLGMYHPMVPERGVAVIEGGSTFGKNGWVVTADGSLVVDLSWFPSEKTNGFSMMMVGKVRHTQRMKGTCLDLCSNWGFGNYAHWLLESLGRVPVMELAGFTWDDFDHIRMPLGKYKQAEKILNSIGFPREKLISPGKDCTMMQFDVLVKPTIAGIPKQFHSSLPDFYRNHVKFEENSGPEKVFIRRTAKLRKLLNAEEVEGLLLKRGFQIIDPARDPFGAISTARVIIGSHQAGLSDVMFTHPGAHILELLPTDHQSQYYQSVARQSGHFYECLLSPSTKRRSCGYGVSPYNFTADVSEIEKYLNEIGA